MTIRALSTLLFLLVQSQVNAWGMDGHYIVAAIAERIVSDRVIAGVNETLGRGQDMISVACWADQASHSAEYRWTAPLHFVDTPTRQCKMDYVRDCPNDFCVIGAIYNYTNRAISETESRAGREFAMKLVIHFLGDVHQPLHVGFRGDRGGNEIHVTTDFAPPGPRHKVESKLHQVWDTGIITQDEFELRVARRREHRKIPPHEPYKHKYEERWHELLEHLWAKLSKGGEFAKHREEWLQPCRTNGLLECTKTMAEESLAVACTAAYHDEYRRWIADGDVLDRDYFLSRNPLMEEQLAKGGVRLAWVLQQMFGSHRHRHHRHSHKKKQPHIPKTGEEGQRQWDPKVEPSKPPSCIFQLLQRLGSGLGLGLLRVVGCVMSWPGPTPPPDPAAQAYQAMMAAAHIQQQQQQQWQQQQRPGSAPPGSLLPPPFPPMPGMVTPPPPSMMPHVGVAMPPVMPPMMPFMPPLPPMQGIVPRVPIANPPSQPIGPIWERISLPAGAEARDELRSKLLGWDMELDGHGEALQGDSHLAEGIRSCVNELCSSVAEQQRIQMSLYNAMGNKVNLHRSNLQGLQQAMEKITTSLALLDEEKCPALAEWVEGLVATCDKVNEVFGRGGTPEKVLNASPFASSLSAIRESLKSCDPSENTQVAAGIGQRLGTLVTDLARFLMESRQTVQRLINRLSREDASQSSSPEEATPAATSTVWNPFLDHLPIDDHRPTILDRIKKQTVTLIHGDTGCGKSSRVPQFILEADPKARIVVTQPRRLAAITLANRVRDELTRCGRNGSALVGYRIGGGEKSESAEGEGEPQILFVTTGYLLQSLVQDPTRLYSNWDYVILDEAHERGMDVDLVMSIVRLMRRQTCSPDFKVIVMSATLQGKVLADYFRDLNADNARGSLKPIYVGVKRFAVESYFLDDLWGLSRPPDVSSGSVADKMRARNQTSKILAADSGEGISKLTKLQDTAAEAVDSKAAPANYTGLSDLRDSMDLWGDSLGPAAASDAVTKLAAVNQAANLSPATKYDVLVWRLIQHFCDGGDSVVVFLPGIAEIYDLNNYYRSTIEPTLSSSQIRCEVVVLHSTVPIEYDSDGNLPRPGDNEIRVYLSTNIAESSVTIPGVKLVIDTCIARQVVYDQSRETVGDSSYRATLKNVWTSQASSMQRMGRAGRESNGLCIRLVTRRWFNTGMTKYDRCEMQRAPLEKIYLNSKYLCQQLVKKMPRLGLLTARTLLLEHTPEPPDLASLNATVNSLERYGALTPSPGGTEQLSEITILGKLCIVMPLELRLCKIVLLSVWLGCALDGVLIASALSSQDPFTMPTMLVMKDWRQFGRSAKSSYEARSKLDGGSYSEPLMLRNLLRSWLVSYYHSGGADGSDRQSVLKHTMDFCRSTKLAVIPQRLTNIVMTVMDVSNRLLKMLEPGTLAYRQISCLLELLGLGADVAEKEVVESLENFGPADDALMQAMLCGAFMPNLIVGRPGRPQADETPLTLALEMDNATEAGAASLLEGLLTSGILSSKDRVRIDVTQHGVIFRAPPRTRSIPPKRKVDDYEGRAKKRRTVAGKTKENTMDDDMAALEKLAEGEGTEDKSSSADQQEVPKDTYTGLGVSWNDVENAWVVKRREKIGDNRVVVRKAFISDENTSLVKARMDAINWFLGGSAALEFPAELCAPFEDTVPVLKLLSSVIANCQKGRPGQLSALPTSDGEVSVRPIERKAAIRWKTVGDPVGDDSADDDSTAAICNWRNVLGGLADYEEAAYRKTFFGVFVSMQSVGKQCMVDGVTLLDPSHAISLILCFLGTRYHRVDVTVDVLSRRVTAADIMSLEVKGLDIPVDVFTSIDKIRWEISRLFEASTANSARLLKESRDLPRYLSEMLVPWEENSTNPPSFDTLVEDYNKSVAEDPELEMASTVTLRLAMRPSTPSASSSPEPSTSGFISWDDGPAPTPSHSFSAEDTIELLPCYELETKIEGHFRQHNELSRSLTRFAGFSDVIETHLFRAASAKKALDRARQEEDLTKRAEAVARVFDLLSRCGEGLAEVQRELDTFDRLWNSLEPGEQIASKVMRGRAKYLSDVIRTKADKCRLTVGEIHNDALSVLDEVQNCIADSAALQS